MIAAAHEQAQRLIEAWSCGRLGCDCARRLADGSQNVHCPGPSHRRGDQQPGCNVTVKNNKLLVTCYGGCTKEQVWEAVRTLEGGPGLSAPPVTHRQRGDHARPASPPPRPLFTREDQLRDPANPQGPPIASHWRQKYSDGTKKIWWERDGKKGLGGLRSSDLPLFRAERLAERPDDQVLVVEGEEATLAAERLGVLCLGTVTGAASAPSLDVLRCLVGRDVLLWPDNDDEGRRHMDLVAERLGELGVRARVVEWGEAPDKGDAANFASIGETAERLGSLLAAAHPWTPRTLAERTNGGESAPAGADDQPELQVLLPGDQMAEDIAYVPPLPGFAQLSSEAEALADQVRAQWLEPFIRAGKAFSPRSPRSLLEACALIAPALAIARRAYLQVGGKRQYTTFFAIFVARSTVYAKTTALDFLRLVLRDAGLGHLLLPSSFTPQALVADLALAVPTAVREGTHQEQQRWLERHAHGAQRGFVRDEVAGLLDDCSKDYNSGLLPLLLKLDGAPDELEADLTISRGLVQADHVCMNWFGATTPSALREQASKSQHWTNGFFGRVGLIAPDEPPTDAFWPDDAVAVPPTLLTLLRWVYESLPIPSAEYAYAPPSRKKGKKDGEPDTQPRILGAQQVGYRATRAAMTSEAWDGYRQYDRALLQLSARQGVSERLDANYGRLPAIAARMALTLAVIDWALVPSSQRPPYPTVALGHWAAAQQIAERWREGAHRILAAALRSEVSEERSKDSIRLLRVLREKGAPLTRGDTLRRLNWPKARLDQALVAVGDEVRQWQEQTGGRPSQWLEALPEHPMEVTTNGHAAVAAEEWLEIE